MTDWQTAYLIIGGAVIIVALLIIVLDLWQQLR